MKPAAKRYYEPNAHLRDDANKEKHVQKILVRFKNEDDVRAFTEKTGILLIRNKFNEIQYRPSTPTLDF